jgi:hypothetical protein
VNDQGTKNDPSGTHVAAWVSYCKSKSYDVPLWEIGNEPEGMAPANWNLGDWDSTQMRWYLNRFNEQAIAMKAISQSIQIMGPQVLSVASMADSLKVLSAYAHKKTNGSVQVMLVNKSAQTTVDINLTGIDPTGHHAKIYEQKPVTEVSGIDVIYNGTVNPNPSGKADLPAPGDSICKGPTTMRTLPAYSITMIDFQWRDHGPCMQR